MTMERQSWIPHLVMLSLLTALFLELPSALSAQSPRPPSEPPADWGPISINMEEIEYPHPFEFMNFRVFGQDLRIAYLDVAPVGPANGGAVVFHHGGSYYGWYWEKQIDALRDEGYRVIVKDRLGWGKSSKPILPYSMSLHASNTAQLMEHLGLSEAAVVGHSIGGQMVTRFAFLYPEKTTHLVTINQIGLTDNRAGRGFRPFDGEIDADPDLQRAYEADVRTDTGRYVHWKPEFLKHLRIRHGQRLSGDWPRLAYVRRLGGNLRSMDTVVNDWPNIRTKTLILGGEIDGPQFPENARRAVEILPNAEVFLIPNAGHNPHEEVPNIVNRELVRFLGSDPTEPAGR
ncbi:MAG: alpha/beta hydrolase [Acidobacteriota bacterium]|nr:alpha/beta hydrolase [Acidobacteriota bacterium]